MFYRLKADAVAMEAAKKIDFVPVNPEAVSFQPTVLRQKRLLWPYYLIPLFLIIPLADISVFGGTLKRSLPSTPDIILLYTIFFVFPHIIASSILMMNSDYVAQYRKKMALGLAGSIALAVTIPLTIGYLPLLLVFGILTVNHVIGQQVGFARIGLSESKWTFQIWKYSALILGNLAYIYIYLKNEYLPIQRETIFISAGGLYFVTLIFCAKLFRKATTDDSKKFLIANQVLFSTIVLLAFIDYSFFAILVPRVIHDSCAFMTYWVHDKNRIAAGKSIAIEMPANWNLHAAAATPVAALLIAFPVTWYYNSYYGEIVGIIIALFHYFTESFAWKRGSPLRRWVPMR